MLAAGTAQLLLALIGAAAAQQQEGLCGTVLGELADAGGCGLGPWLGLGAAAAAPASGSPGPWGETLAVARGAAGVQSGGAAAWRAAIGPIARMVRLS